MILKPLLQGTIPPHGGQVLLPWGPLIFHPWVGRLNTRENRRSAQRHAVKVGL